MLRRIRITPSMAIAIVALVFAATGGAFAATGGGGASHATATAAKSKAKPKTKAGPRGPAGPAGKNGANGATGPAGPAGAAGAKGETGAAGGNGANGEKGETGAKGETGPQGPQGDQGGAGSQGATGEPWTPNNTLPAKATETGTWITTTGQLGTVSFPIKLAAELSKVHVIGPDEGEEEAHPAPAITSGECKGKLASPGAGSGNFCLFIDPRAVSALENVEANIVNPTSASLGTGVAGALLSVSAEEGKNPAQGVQIYGTWAVTG